MSARARRWGRASVRFRFSGGENRELPLIVRPDTDPAETLLGGAGLPGDDSRPAARQRPLPGRGLRDRALSRTGARRGLLGPRPAGPALHRQFRPHSLRVLPRPDSDPRSAQGRRHRLPAGEHLQVVGHGIRHRAGAEGVAEEGEHRARPGRGHAGFRVQRPARPLQGPAGAPRAGLRLRFRMVEPDALLRHLQPHGELFRQLGARLPRACRRAGSWSFWSPSGTACRPRSSPSRSSCRKPTGKAGRARTTAPRSAC